MGFLDKVKAQAETVAKQGKEKLDDFKEKREADGLLKDLGAAYYAGVNGTGGGQAELDRLVAEIRAFEAENGPIGGDGSPATPAAGDFSAPPAAAPPAMAPPVPPTPVETAAPPVPPAPSAPPAPPVGEA